MLFLSEAAVYTTILGRFCGHSSFPPSSCPFRAGVTKFGPGGPVSCRV